MLTAFRFRDPPGHEPPPTAALHPWLGGWPGIGRTTAGMARQEYDLQLARYGQEGLAGDVLPGRNRPLADADGEVGLDKGAVVGGAGGRPASRRLGQPAEAVSEGIRRPASVAEG